MKPLILSLCLHALAALCHAQQTHTALLTADPGAACDIVGIAESMSGLKVYPNPTSDVLTIVCPDSGMALNIHDMKGRLLVSISSMGGTQRLDLSHLSQGVYILTAESVQGRSHQRIVISR